MDSVTGLGVTETIEKLYSRECIKLKIYLVTTIQSRGDATRQFHNKALIRHEIEIMMMMTMMMTIMMMVVVIMMMMIILTNDIAW